RCRSSGSRAARYFVGVARESALRGDQAAAVTARLADRPVPGSLQVVDVDVGGHAEKNEGVSDSVRADQQVAGALVSIILWVVGVHRETSGGFSRQWKHRRKHMPKAYLCFGLLEGIQALNAPKHICAYAFVLRLSRRNRGAKCPNFSVDLQGSSP